ncbi:DUF1990 family protein [Microbacterium stercoris]|uniref:DUF1990 domain-containing protein n=1 Tax=Microbacterium stercoris TaxID=2820289 RepID=A0A939QPK9_9MICO|nr:DUF1990 domain-containing protein [Microbacterium stercoris]MBO3662618.1 DUF1990 domain-containing protein [Microbacterium stercoris]
MRTGDAFTYEEIGATRRDDLVERPPRGYRAIDRRVRLGEGDDLWRAAGDAVVTWDIQRRSGIRVSAPHGGELRPDDVAIMRIGLWPRDVPARVVYVVDEPRARGFAYGTLRRHPERGEELFLVERDDDGSVWLRIRAFSRPASWLFWASYPAVLLMQRIYTDRYLRALMPGSGGRA